MYSTNKPQCIVVCFPAGAGGHLIGTICSVLTGRSGVLPDERGSMHTNSIIHLNSTLHEDDAIRTELPAVDVVIGHFTNLALLSELGKQVIYITFTQDDVDEIVYRANKKTTIDLTDKNTYKKLAGVSWPSYDEFLSGKSIPTGESNWAVSKNTYSHWAYNLPNDKSSILEITFDEINTSQTLIDRIATFLKIDNYNRDNLMQLLHTYRLSQVREEGDI